MTTAQWFATGLAGVGIVVLLSMVWWAVGDQTRVRRSCDHVWVQAVRPMRCKLCGRHLVPWRARVRQAWWRWRYR